MDRARTPEHRGFRVQTLAALTLTFVFLMGIVATELYVHQERRDFEDSLLSRARIAASSFLPDEITALRGVPDDAQRPEFRYIKDRLERMLAQNRSSVRFMYLVYQRDGEVVFLADAEPQASSDYSPPGQVYKDAPPRLRQVLAGDMSQDAVDGPYTDAWGTWCSIFVPIRSTDGKRIIASLGMDVSAKDMLGVSYRQRVGSWVVWLLLLGLLGVLLAFLGYRQRVLEQIRESEEFYRSLFTNMLNGFAYCRMIYDDKGEPIDWEYMDVNDAYAKHTGLHIEGHAGRRASQVLPGLYESSFDLLSLYGQVVKTGRPQTFEAYFESVNRWIAGSVYQPKPGYFAVTITDVSETQRAFQALHDSESRANAILDTAADAIIVIDERGVIQSFNNAAERTFGYSAGEVIGQSVNLLMPEPHRGLHDGYLRRYLETNVSHIIGKNREVPGQHKDGTVFPMELSVGEFRLNETRAFAGIARDISRRKQSEQMLALSEARLKLALESSNQGLWDWDVPSGRVYYDAQWSRILHYAPNEVEQSIDMWKRTVHPEDLPRVMDALNAHHAGRADVYETEYRARTKDGRWVWLSACGRVIERDRRQAPLRMIGTIADISERKAAEHALAAANAEKDAVLQAASEVSIIATSLNGMITVFNYGAERMLGYSAEEVIGRQAPTVMHLPSEVETRAAELSEELGRPISGFETFVARAREGQPEQREWTYVRKDGSQLLVSLVVTAAHDPKGKISGFLGVAIDITTRKRNEEQLQRQTLLLQAVADVANLLVTADDYETAVERALETLARAARVDRVRVFERHTDADTGEDIMSQRFAYCSPGVPEPPHLADMQRVPFSRVFPRWRREMLLRHSIRGVTSSFPRRERLLLRHQGIRSFLGTPIFIRGQFWGSIGFDECHWEREWSDAEVAILALCAEIIAGAVTRDRAEKAVRKSNDLLEAVHEVQSQFIADLDARDLFARLLESVLDLTRSTFGAIARVSYTEDRNALIETMGVVCRPGGDSALGGLEALFRQIGETAQSVVTGGRDVSDPDAQSFLGVPLVRGKRLVGIIGLSGRPDGYDRALLDHLAPLLAACAGIIDAYRADTERRQAEETVQRQREWFRVTLSSIGDAVMATDTAENVTFLNPVAERLIGLPSEKALGMPIRDVFTVVDAETLTPIISPTERALREGGIVELPGDCLLIGHDGNRTPIDDSAAPIQGADGRVHGAVLVFRDVSERKRLEQEMALSREREVNIGARIQQTLLLGRPPTDLPAAQVGAFTAASQRIDGDFYDFLPHSDNHLDLVVGDVMGKGVPAALVGAATKGRFYQALSELALGALNGSIPSPADIVNAVHRSMTDQLVFLDSFVTLCYARFHMDTSELEYVDCGHTKTIHYRAAARDCTQLKGHNLPLGVLVDEVYEQFSERFEEGDLFVFYSDGLTEATNEQGEAFGEERLATLIKQCSSLSPSELIGALWSAAVAFKQSEEFLDDLTCLVVKIGAARQEDPLSVAELTLLNHLDALAAVRSFVRSFCGHIALPGDGPTLEKLELGVDEAVTNVIRHAYCPDTECPIRVRAEVYTDRLIFFIEHWGKAFYEALVPPPSFDGSQSNGFGIHIIRQCFDEVNYLRDREGKNTIRLLKQFS